MRKRKHKTRRKALKTRGFGWDLSYVNYGFCDMLPRMQVLGPSKQDLIIAIR
jgi:hypothetical protein